MNLRKTKRKLEFNRQFQFLFLKLKGKLMENRIITLLLAAMAITCIILPTYAHSNVASYELNYPARYMGGNAKIVTAPNGALIYDKALESVGKIVYTEPIVENIGDGIWIIGG